MKYRGRKWKNRVEARLLPLLLPVLQPWLPWLSRPWPPLRAHAGFVSVVFLGGPCGRVPQSYHHRQQQGGPRESTKTPILQRRSLKNGPEVKQCVRGSAGCISERAAARAQLTGSLCPLPGHHAASEASPFCTLCLQEHPPSSRPGRAFSARRLCRGASRPPALDAPSRASVLAVWAPRAGWALWSVWPRLLPFSRFNVPSASRAASSQESAGGS